MSFNSRHNTAFASSASTRNEKADSRQNDAELCFLIAHYLLGGPFASIGRQLVERMNQLGFVPITHDWRHGHNVKESFASYSKLHHEINHHSLPSLVRYAAKLHASSHSRDATEFATKSKPDGQSESLTLAAPIAVAPATSAVPSVLSTSPSASITAEQRDGRTPADTPISIVNIAAYANLVLNPSIKRLIVPGHQRVKNIYQRILRHEIGLRIVAADHPKHFMYNTLKAMKKVCGHLLPVYCTIFDRSGGMFFTGADDHLIKAWSTNSASLLRTFRGNIVC